jgi:TonB family protein
MSTRETNLDMRPRRARLLRGEHEAAVTHVATTHAAVVTGRDETIFRRSLGVSVLAHVILILAGGIFASSAQNIDVSQGYVVELLEFEEPAPIKVEAPQESASESPQGTIEVPEHREMPKTKPRKLPPRDRPKPKRVADKPKTTPTAAATAPPDTKAGGGGQVETDVPFPFDYYTETVTRLITAQWVPTTGTVDGTKNLVTFDIYQDGSVGGLEIEKSAGHALFDASTLAAIRAVGRFPPLPQGFASNRIRIHFHFEYGRGS